MKKNQLILVSAMLFVALTSCQKSPEAGISADKTTAKVNETITVISTSKDANAFAWVLSDGTVTLYRDGNNTKYADPSSHLIKVSGGDFCDDTFVFKLDSIGTYTLRLDVYYYKDKCNVGKDIGKYDEATLKISITP